MLEIAIHGEITHQHKGGKGGIFKGRAKVLWSFDYKSIARIRLLMTEKTYHVLLIREVVRLATTL
jgi:hypothetical protein